MRYPATEKLEIIRRVERQRPLVMLLSGSQMSDFKGAAVAVDPLPMAKALLSDKRHDAD